MGWKTVARQTAPVYTKTKLKVWIETIAFLLLLLVFMTGLDPERNQGWINALLVVVVGVGILNNLWLYRSLSVNAQGDDLKTSLQKTKKKLWQQLWLASIFSALFFGTVFLFLFQRIALSSEKLGLLLLFLVASISIRTGVEVWRWQKHIRQLDQSLADLVY